MVLSQMSTTTQYENLKRAIVREISCSFGLEEAKMYFAPHVNSRRFLGRIKSLEELFYLLEIRSILHCNEVGVLQYLGEKLKKEVVVNFVHGYQKLYAKIRPCVCGELVPFIPVMFNEHKNSELNLDQAIKNLSENIGCKWRVLVSQLNVPECYVDEIRVKHPFDFAKQASEILQVWKRLNKESASVEILRSALETRLCKREGIGLHMLKPVVAVD